MINTCLDITMSILDTLILYQFMTFFFVNKFRDKRPYIVICVALVAFLHFIGSMFIPNDSFFKFIFVFIIDVSFCLTIFISGKKLKKFKHFVFVGLYYLLMAISETFSGAIITSLDPEFLIFETNHYNIPILIAILFSRISIFIFMILIRIFKNKEAKRNYWQGLLIIPFISAFFIWITFNRYWSLGDKAINSLLLSFAVLLLVQNAFIFVYMVIVHGSTERYYEIKAAYERQKQYAAGVSGIQQAIRKLAHDFRHHLIYLMSALNQEDIPKAKDYITELDKNLDDSVALNITGHYDVDALLYAKSKIASQCGVKIQIVGSLPPEINISPIDLSVVLGNAVDNAIEAAGSAASKEVTVSFIYKSNRLYFTVENNYRNELKPKSNGLFLSSKSEGRGLGLDIINQVVNKYNGHMRTTYDQETFTLTLMLQTSQAVLD